jgi:hypothetical protein
MTIDKQKLKALADRVKTDRRFCADEHHYVLADGVQALLAEIERLTGFVVRRRAQADEYDEALCKIAAQRDQLKAENEALRKDAGNWRVVERAMEQLKSDEQGAAIWSVCSRLLISIASDLNAARSVVTEEGVTKDGAEIGDWRVTVERLAMAKEASHG